MSARRWLQRALVAVVLLVAAWVLVPRLLASDPVQVVTAPVERGTVESIVANTKAGTVEARRRAKLSTGTAGIVVELGAERGDRVAAGAVLLRLADGTEQAALARAEKALRLAEAGRRRACLAAERAARIHERDARLVAESGIVSTDQLDASRSAWELAAADCDVAAAEVAVTEADVERARVELDKTVLLAPFDAVIAEVGVELGEWVTPSVPLVVAPDLIDAIDPTSLFVSAPMDEADARVFHVGQPARVTIDSHPGHELAGRVARIAPYVLDVEQQNRTLEIEVELEDAAFSETLYPGTSADVEVLLETRADVLRVPTYALFQVRDSPGTLRQAYVLAGGRLERRDVTTGLSNWEWTEVVSGLAAGERVVTSLDGPGIAAGVEAAESAQ